jgi:uncharacterized membrane protein
MAAVGTVTVTTTDLGGSVTKYSAAWLSSAGGVVSGTSFDVRRGRLYQAKFVPNTGGTVPTDAYDLTLTDADGADLLIANGANLSATVAAWYSPTNPIHLEGGAVTPVIANAGNAKGGALVLIVGP